MGRNLTFPTVEVQTSGGPMAVRGLSLDNILGLFYRHGEEVTALYNSLLQNQSQSIEDVTILGIKMISAAPLVVAEIITIACGYSPTDSTFAAEVEVSRQLSLGEQLDALQKIAAQTFTTDMPPGKTLALVLQAMQAGRSAAVNLQPQA